MHFYFDQYNSRRPNRKVEIFSVIPLYNCHKSSVVIDTPTLRAMTGMIINDERRLNNIGNFNPRKSDAWSSFHLRPNLNEECSSIDSNTNREISRFRKRKYNRRGITRL